MTRTMTLEAAGGASVDKRISLTGQGSVGSPNLQTPAGARKITSAVLSVGTSVAVAGRATLLVRIGGTAVKNGEQTFIVAAEGYVAVQSGADTPGLAQVPLVLDDIDLDVDPSENIVVDVEMMDDDLGDVHGTVTLIFD